MALYNTIVLLASRIEVMLEEKLKDKNNNNPSKFISANEPYQSADSFADRIQKRNRDIFLSSEESQLNEINVNIEDLDNSSNEK